MKKYSRKKVSFDLNEEYGHLRDYYSKEEFDPYDRGYPSDIAVYFDYDDLGDEY